jgi:hypothetical protein
VVNLRTGAKDPPVRALGGRHACGTPLAPIRSTIDAKGGAFSADCVAPVAQPVQKQLDHVLCMEKAVPNLLSLLFERVQYIVGNQFLVSDTRCGSTYWFASFMQKWDLVLKL